MLARLGARGGVAPKAERESEASVVAHRARDLRVSLETILRPLGGSPAELSVRTLRLGCALRAALPAEPFRYSVTVVRHVLAMDVVTTWAATRDPAATPADVYRQILRGARRGREAVDADGLAGWAWEWIVGLGSLRASNSERMVAQQEALAVAIETLGLISEATSIRASRRADARMRGQLRLRSRADLDLADESGAVTRVVVAERFEAHDVVVSSLAFEALLNAAFQQPVAAVGWIDIEAGTTTSQEVDDDLIDEGLRVTRALVARLLEWRAVEGRVPAHARDEPSSIPASLWEYATPSAECRFCALADHCPRSAVRDRHVEDLDAPL